MMDEEIDFPLSSLQSQLLPTAAGATTNRWRTAAARSLSVFLLANLLWPAVIICLFPSGQNYQARTKPDWCPSVPAIHIATLGSAFLMGLAGWLVWADGGFQAQEGEDSGAWPVYLSQMSTGVTWHPAVLRIGSAELGWVFGLVNFGVLFACYERFRVNPIAGALVMPALAWSVYLSFVTCSLIYV